MEMSETSWNTKLAGIFDELHTIATFLSMVSVVKINESYTSKPSLISVFNTKNKIIETPFANVCNSSFLLKSLKLLIMRRL